MGASQRFRQASINFQTTQERQHYLFPGNSHHPLIWPETLNRSRQSNPHFAYLYAKQLNVCLYPGVFWIKRTILGLYSWKIAPTVSIIHKEIKHSIKISKSKLTLTLIDLGYTYEKIGDNRRVLYDQVSLGFFRAGIN
jgi:hypothetical protein